MSRDMLHLPLNMTFLLVDQLACRTHNLEVHSCYREQVEPRRSLRVSRGSQGSIHDTENLFCYMQGVKQGWASTGAHSMAWRRVGIPCKEEQTTHRAAGPGLYMGSSAGGTQMTMKLRQLLVAFALM